MSRRVAAVLVAVVAAACAVIAAPASAASLPQLTSISVSANQVTAPGQTTLMYTATADYPITRVWGDYVSPEGADHFIYPATGTAGSGVLSLPDGVLNGKWPLSFLALIDSNGDVAHICAAGGAQSSLCTSYADLSAATVTVSGSNADQNAPLISSVSVAPNPVQPGTTTAISWVDDEVHAVTSASFTFENLDPHAQSDTVTFQSPAGADLSTRRFAVPLKPFAFNGAYQLTKIVIQDSLGNQATYLPGGTTQLSRYAISPTSHALDFAAITFTVTGSTQGLAPPQLTSLTVSPPSVPTYNPIVVQDQTTDPSSRAVGVTATFIGPDGKPTTSWPIGTSGELGVDHQYGTYQLSEVLLKDSRGNLMVYRRDGSTYNPITDAVGSHSFNFPHFDQTILPTAPKLVGAWSSPGALAVRWSYSLAETYNGVTGARITVNPGGYSTVVPATTDASQLYTLRGLTNGVAYTVTLTTLAHINAESATTRVTVIPGMSDHFFSTANQNGDAWLVAVSAATDGKAWIYARSGGGYAARTQYTLLYPTPVRETSAGDGVFGVDADGRLEVSGAFNGIEKWQAFGLGWDSMRFLAGGFDFTGDRVPDLYATSQTGELYLYPVLTTSNGLSTAPRRYIGSGWNTMQTVFSAGDFNGDHKADLMAVDGAGVLWLYPGNGQGGFQRRVQVGSGWGGFGAVFNLGDFTGTGHNDIGAVDLSGKLWRYAVTGTGRFTGGRTLIGTGWNGYF
ncbi:MAG TPA: VCBS repeat-containing protein [Pedococcus sp.]|jgi:hypothetical protein|nr:VCBS repeat-containing protein [Pedococcus sp.]